jgi:putative membrane protein insertion efficiency factor
MRPRQILIGVIGVYRRFVSPMLPASCRYWPTCSEYTVQAVQKYGIFRGGLMGAWRVLRCNPWSRGGIDSVR